MPAWMRECTHAKNAIFLDRLQLPSCLLIPQNSVEVKNAIKVSDPKGEFIICVKKCPVICPVLVGVLVGVSVGILVGVLVGVSVGVSTTFLPCSYHILTLFLSVSTRILSVQVPFFVRSDTFC